MLAVVVVIFVIALACSCAGVMLAAYAVEPRAEVPPPVPLAQVANPSAAERTRARRARLSALARELLRRGTILAMGGALVVLPWLAVVAIIASLLDAGDAFRFEGGRVLRVRRRVRLADRVIGNGWVGRAVQVAPVADEDVRRALAARWLAIAHAEHASAPAFAQLGLQLAALGAPARLLAAAHRAALDEIDHAERCFAIARALSGVANTAGPIPALGGHRPAIDLVTLALESLRDGCVGEGVAAEIAERGASTAVAPDVAATLARIADDERRHAALAWDLVTWCIDTGDERVRRRLGRAIDALSDSPVGVVQVDGLDAAVLEAHGLVPAPMVTTFAARRIAEVQVQARARLAPLVRVGA